MKAKWAIRFYQLMVYSRVVLDLFAFQAALSVLIVSPNIHVVVMWEMVSAHMSIVTIKRGANN